VSYIKHTFQYGNHEVTLSSGKVARQADAAVVVEFGETTLLVTVVYDKNQDSAEFKDFFPLSVHYQEKAYAFGKIPGGFNKREGRPTERETLISRLIDRPIRPMFPKDFVNEVQVVITLLSMDPSDEAVDVEVPAMLGVSAALGISGLPVSETTAAAKIGYIDGEFVLNPYNKDMPNSKLDLVVAGTKNAPLMIESEAKELDEATMLDAVFFGQEKMQHAINEINTFIAKGKKESFKWTKVDIAENIVAQVREKAFEGLKAAYAIQNKIERQDELSKIRKDVLAQMAEVSEDFSKNDETMVKAEIERLESEIVRSKVIKDKLRIDGRSPEEIRQITVNAGILPRTHGSSLFTRGETQAIAVCTLGTERDSQLIESPEGMIKDTFMLHYNFPPYSVGELGNMAGPKRREIGHGKLAKRALMAMMPSYEEFPYVIRIVSEITESNGSSSMATVCGSSLALMDAGVPFKKPVAGIAMGLVKESDDFVVLSDIMGAEDHLGDMDFKVAGTKEGITALQMDIKIEGINRDIMDTALKQAHNGREHILGIMCETLSNSRDELADTAPRIKEITIKPEKVKEVIGKAGKTIKALTEEHGVSIDIKDTGEIRIAAPDLDALESAEKAILDLTAEAEVGKIYNGKVVKIMDFGAFVNFLPGQDGLVHISQVSEERVENVGDYLQEGQNVNVKVLGIDNQGRVKLSIKEALES